MFQPVSRDRHRVRLSGRRVRPSGHSVAELVALSDLIPAPRLPSDGGPANLGPISVGSLLRREGRAPHAVDRPLQPRGHQRPVVLEERWIDRATMRRAGAAAGALVAAASVFGAAVVTDATGRLPRIGDEAGLPGAAVPDAADGGANFAFGPLAAGSDFGINGPLSLASFSSVLPGGGPVAGTQAAAFLTPGAAAGIVPAGGGPATGAGPPGGGRGSAPVSGGAGPVQTAVRGVTRPVDNLTQSVGDAAPAPLSAPVKAVGSTVGKTGDALGSTVDSVAKPVTGLLNGGKKQASGKSSGSNGSGSSDDGGSKSSGGDSGSGKSSGGLLDSVGRTASGLVN